jgi:hypothetical protein
VVRRPGGRRRRTTGAPRRRGNDELPPGPQPGVDPDAAARADAPCPQRGASVAPVHNSGDPRRTGPHGPDLPRSRPLLRSPEPRPLHNSSETAPLAPKQTESEPRHPLLRSYAAGPRALTQEERPRTRPDRPKPVTGHPIVLSWCTPPPATAPPRTPNAPCPGGQRAFRGSDANYFAATTCSVMTAVTSS